ncbi:hypothetical protein LJC34_02600 [Oscillospiraceae bacterium OttesenSCG-928-G22]|nr:hypothetical protein [Oscillospiraceae bacterium OttesenSCG-928-G22]
MVDITFSSNELQEILYFKEHAEGLSINGVEINCYSLVYKLASGEYLDANISPSEIRDAIAQVQLERDSLDAVGFVDVSLYNKILLMLESY